MLRGIDISSWQGSVDYSAYDFVIIKASEGKNSKDPALDRHLAGLFGTTDPTPQKEKCYGFYHYARPDLGNTPEQEAKSFLSYIGTQVGNCVMALDWEGDSLKYSVDWAKGWLDYVYKQTGVKPMLYIQASQAKLAKYAPIANADYGLWVAHWGVSSPTFSNWKNWAIWQWTSTPLDQNYFNGSKAAWWKYCGRDEKEEEDLNETETRKIADEQIAAYFKKLEQETASSSWSKMAITWAMSNGIMVGDKEGDPDSFRPKDLPTREELAQVAYNIYKNLIAGK